MHQDIEARMAARAWLCGEVAALAGEAERLRPAALADRIESVRRIAAATGLVAADRVCRAFLGTLGQSLCRNSFRPWFAALADAAGCEAADEEAVADACLAAVMVRMA